jgi:hypothetical protein
MASDWHSMILVRRQPVVNLFAMPVVAGISAADSRRSASEPQSPAVTTPPRVMIAAGVAAAVVVASD